MIANIQEFRKAQEELRSLEVRLQRLEEAHAVGSKGFAEAGIHKMIARLHDEMALFEGS